MTAAPARGGPVAAIDCGTNSTRLLVSDGSPEPLARLMRITRLGAGVDATGRLREDAVVRTVAVLEEYRAVMDDLGVPGGAVRITATSAGRDASNRAAFFDAAEAAVGRRPELLDGAEEARISYLGATAELAPADGPFLVCDIGGGSTEFAVGPGGGDPPEGGVSIDVGCVRLSERWLRHDPPAPDELSQAISVVRDHLDDVQRDLPGVVGAARLVGLAGTVTTVAAVEIGLHTYDRDRIHHFVLTRDAAEDVFRTLATETRADRVHNPGLEEARADVIVGGCCILVAVMRHWNFDSLLVSEADILDGLAHSLLA